MRKETMQTTFSAPYEAPESTVFYVSAERNIMSGGTIETPEDEPQDP